MSELTKHVLATSLGEVWLWGEADALGDPRPVVLYISGAFAAARSKAFELRDLVPGGAVLNAHLPGNHCPPLLTASVGAYASAYSRALDAIGRPAVVVGSSVGALVALAMRSQTIRGLVLIEPPMQTAKLWPLRADFRRKLAAAPGDADLAGFIWSVFGISATAHENRDYRSLLERLEQPSWAILGDAPLMPERPLSGGMPSLVDAPERALLAAHPLVKTRVAASAGHNVISQALGAIAECVQDLLDRHVAAPAQPLV